MTSNGLFNPLQASLDEFEKALSPAQRDSLHSCATVPGANAVITFTAELDRENAKRRSRCVASRLCGTLDSIMQFSTVVDTFIQANPRVAALIWGSVKLTFLAVVNFSSYFNKLSSLFMNIRNHCPRFQEYSALYSNSRRLQDSLCKYYSIVVRLCHKAIDVIQRPGFSQIVWSIWKPFENEFASIQTELQTQYQEVRDDIQLASEEAAHGDRQLQETFRKNIEIDGTEHKKRKKLSQKQRLIDKISNYNPMLAYKQARSKRHGRTGFWISHNDAFRAWLSTEHSSLLWCSGNMGSGKTVLTASLLDELFREKATHSIVYFFCQFDNSVSLLASTIVSCLLKQLLSPAKMTEPFIDQLSNLLEAGPAGTRELGDILEQVIEPLTTTLVVVDGLDECSKQERNLLLKTLQKLTCSDHGKIKIFIASRSNIEREIKGYFVYQFQMSMNSAEVRSDIDTYIDDALEDKLNDGELQIGNTSLLSDISKALKEGAQGMFLWVFFQIQDICDQTCDADIRSTIQNFPKDLSETYKRTLKKIVRAKKSDLAIKVLRWVIAAKRPLSLDEIREAVAINMDQKHRQSELLVNDHEQLIHACASLVVLDEYEHMVQFAHHSVKSFLTLPPDDSSLADFQFNLLDANLKAGEACVVYLNYSDFQKQIVKSPQFTMPPPIDIMKVSLESGLSRTIATSWSLLEKIWSIRNNTNTFVLRQTQEGASLQNSKSLQKLQHNYAFLAYASEYWLVHTSDLTPENVSLWRRWTNLLAEGSLGQKPWAFDEWVKSHTTVLQWIVKNSHHALLTSLLKRTDPPLSLGQKQYLLVALVSHARLGLLDIALRSLMDSDVNLELLLYTAALGGKTNVVQRLLATEVSLERSRLCRRALHEAAKNGHLDVVDQLLTAGADANKKSLNGETALQAAAAGGHVDVVKALLMFDVDVNAHPLNTGRTALQAAISSSNHELLEILLASHADVNAAPAMNYGRTALQEASERGCIFTVQILLQAGADVDARPARCGGRTALQAAAESGSLAVVEILLAANADVHESPSLENGRTALQAAAENGHLEIAQKLLKAGANVNSPPAPVSGRTALQATAGEGHHIIMDLFLEQTDESRRLEAIAEPFPNRGAYVNAAPALSFGRTALQAAAQGGHKGVLDRLLRLGADLNAKPASTGGRTVLQAAAESGCLEVVETLLALKADVNASPAAVQGRTAMQAAAERGNISIVERLLEVRAHVNAYPSEKQGRTALQAAAEQGHEQIVEKLLANKANVNAEPSPDGGRTALQAAAGMNHVSIVNRLLTAGANVNASSSQKNGLTALQAASMQGNLKIVDILLAAKANVNEPASEIGGRTALQAAAAAGHESITKRLLTARADVNSPPALVEGRTALQAASENGYLKIAKQLLMGKANVDAGPSKYGLTALQAAAKSGSMDTLDLLLAARADVNAAPAQPDGLTALQAAAAGGHINLMDKILEILISSKVDYRSVWMKALSLAAHGGHNDIIQRFFTDPRFGIPSGEHFFSALTEASTQGHLATVKKLVATRTFSQQIITDSGGGREKALQGAAQGGHFRIVKFLRDAFHLTEISLRSAATEGHLRITDILLADGSFTNPKSTDHALRCAAKGGHLKILKKLLGSGWDVDMPSFGPSGRTALQHAAEQGHYRVVEYLMANGADVNAPPASYGGKTALQAAVSGAFFDVIKILLAAGADINARGAAIQGETAMEAAVSRGFKDIATFLNEWIRHPRPLLREEWRISTGSMSGIPMDRQSALACDDTGLRDSGSEDDE